MAGQTYRTTASELGVSVGTAYNRVQEALDAARPHAGLEGFRGVQLAELDQARRPLRRIAATFTDDPDLSVDDLVKAVRALVKVQERETRLLGLDGLDTPMDEVSRMTDQELFAVVSEWREQFQGNGQ